MIQDSVNAQELYRMFKALYDFLAVRRSYRLVRPFFFFPPCKAVYVALTANSGNVGWPLRAWLCFSLA